MMLTWIGYAMLCSAAVAALAGSAEYVFGHRRYTRRGLWIAAMVASTAIPLTASWLTKAPVVIRRDEVVEAPSVAGGDARPSSWSADRVVGVVWAAASLGAALWLCGFHVGLSRRLRRCRHLQLGGQRVLLSPDFGPAVVGVVRARIVLPEWTLALEEGDRRLILVHETEHMRAHDPAMHFIALTLAVLFPWNIALWWQLKRLRLAIEIDCDARVVARHGHDPTRYGEALVAAHSNAAHPTVAALALVQRRSALGRRIDALVALPRRSAARFAGALFVGAGSLGAVAFAPAPSLRDPIVMQAPNTLARRVDLPVRDTAATRVAPVPISTAQQRQPRVVARRLPALVVSELPPARVTPSQSTADVPRASAAPLPTMRGFSGVMRGGGAGGGAGGGGGGRGGAFGGRAMVVQPGGAAAMPTRRDSTAARGAIVRAIRPDSVPPTL